MITAPVVNVSVPGITVQASNSGGAQVNIAGLDISASSSGAHINLGQFGSISANQNGANISLNAIADSVSSDSQLQSYIQNIQKKNTAIRGVQVTSSNVSISYNQPAALFGVFPIQLFTTLTTDAHGKTLVSLPWYSFLTTNNSAQIAASIESSIPNNPNTTLNAQSQAQIIRAANSSISVSVQN